jgi:isopenicillin-N epimerase
MTLTTQVTAHRPEPSSLSRHWGLDEAVVMLNHGSFGACPTAVLQHQQELRAQMEAEPVRFFVRELNALAIEARVRLGEFIGADPDGLALLTNATEGVNTVLRSMTLRPGDEILLFDHAYNACANAVRYVAKRAGAHVRTIEVPFPIADPGDVVERTLAAVTPRTVLAMLDHITSPTGLIMPMEDIVPQLRAKGVKTLIDGAHVPGHIPLDLEVLRPTYYVGNCHKWLCTPKGVAFLYVDDEHRPEIRPLSISHGANRDTAHHSRFRLEFDWLGTSDPTAQLCIPHAIDFMAGLVDGGWPSIKKRNRTLALKGQALLCEALEIPPPAPAAMVGCLAAIPIPDGVGAGSESSLYTDPLQDKLLLDYGIEVPIVPWPHSPHRLVRIASQLYNSEEQMAYLAHVLPELVRPGGRRI